MNTIKFLLIYLVADISPLEVYYPNIHIFNIFMEIRRLVMTACRTIKVLINATASLSLLSLLAFSPTALHQSRHILI